MAEIIQHCSPILTGQGKSLLQLQMTTTTTSVSIEMMYIETLKTQRVILLLHTAQNLKRKSQKISTVACTAKSMATAKHAEASVQLAARFAKFQRVLAKNKNKLQENVY